jgi:hypothetical protein
MLVTQVHQVTLVTQAAAVVVVVVPAVQAIL